MDRGENLMISPSGKGLHLQDSSFFKMWSEYLFLQLMLGQERSALMRN